MTILAKTDESLIEHTENTLKVLKSIKNSYPEVPEICDVSNFWNHLFYSLFFHDFGKAATGFQNHLKGGDSWYYRHEILSACFINSLNNIFNNKELQAIGLCIITHHKDIDYLIENYDINFSTNKRSFLEKMDELKDNFDELIGYFKLIPKLSNKYLGYKLPVIDKITFEDLVNPFDKIIYDFKDDVNSENYDKIHGVYGIFLKGFMNACDYLASGGHYEILNAVENKKFFDFDKYNDIQMQALKTKGSTFLIAPTGSGKTEASLLWVDNNQNENYSKRIFYMLPYTASINAMYERLTTLLKNDQLIGLSHGKSSYFIYKSLNDDSKDQVKQIQNLTKKIYRPYKILTPFQIIKYLFGIKGFEMGLAELANSLIIIDEVHAYDTRTTCLLLETCKFLKDYLKCNIFIMSATLPTFLKDMFSQTLEIDNIISLDNEKLDKFTRHEVNVIDNCIDNYCDSILDDINNGKKVLVVCNTVDKSQKIFKWFKKRGVDNSALLHGKFMLKDRGEIEKILDDLNLLVGTQAIEVSLDIDYDVLYTEPAPFDALIQRFGRINRRGWSENVIKPVNVFTIGSENDKYVYKNQTIVQKTLTHLKNIHILKESKIQEILDDIYGDGYSKKDQEIFNDVKIAFGNMTNRLIPFSNRSKTDFFTLFDSYEVVPLKYCEEYLKKIDNKEFFEAMGYCLNITEGQYFKQTNLNNIKKINKKHYFIDVKYDSKLGLLLSDEELNDNYE